MIADAREISANLAHADWLKELRKGDVVLVQNGPIYFRAEVTDATPCYVFTGKIKFRRDNGWQTAKQQRQVYRMKLRLVRNKEDLC